MENKRQTPSIAAPHTQTQASFLPILGKVSKITHFSRTPWRIAILQNCKPSLKSHTLLRMPLIEGDLRALLDIDMFQRSLTTFLPLSAEPKSEFYLLPRSLGVLPLGGRRSIRSQTTSAPFRQCLELSLAASESPILSPSDALLFISRGETEKQRESPPPRKGKRGDRGEK